MELDIERRLTSANFQCHFRISLFQSDQGTTSCSAREAAVCLRLVDPGSTVNFPLIFVWVSCVNNASSCHHFHPSLNMACRKRATLWQRQLCYMPVRKSDEP